MPVAVAEKSEVKSTVDIPVFSIIVNRGELEQRLASAALVVKSRTPKPVLACALLTAKGKALSIRTTDLAVAIRCIVNEVQIDAPGQVAVSAADLLEWVRIVDGDVISLTLNGDQLVIKGDSSSRTLFTLSPGDFPPEPAKEKEVANYKFPLSALLVATGFVSHALPEVPTSLCPDGALFERDKEVLNVVVSEGRTLPGTAIKGGKLKGEKTNTVIPSDTIRLLSKAIADDGEEEVEIGLSEGAVRIESGNTTIWSQLLQAVFPPWRDIIPKNQPITLTASHECLLHAARRASASQSEFCQKLAIDAGPEGLSMQLRNPERGVSQSQLPCKVTGGTIRVGLNCRRFVAALSAMVGGTGPDSLPDEVQIGFDAPNRPVKITCGPMTEVMMPVNLED